MTVRCKFVCNSVKDLGGKKEAELSAVYSIEGENSDFTNLTPSGNIRVMIDQESKAYEAFKPKGQYFVDFTECPE